MRIFFTIWMFWGLTVRSLSQADLLIITGRPCRESRTKNHCHKHKPLSTIFVLLLCTHQDTEVCCLLMFLEHTDSSSEAKSSEIQLKEPRLFVSTAH